MKDSRFFKQAYLMLRLLPYVAKEKCFGLKGGTAINLFVRDMPRLSVDIDLTYLPLKSREESLKNIHGLFNQPQPSYPRAAQSKTDRL